MTESMAELAAEDMIVALRTQRAQLLERRAEMQMRVIMLEQEENVSDEWGYGGREGRRRGC